ncbi:MAG: SBBP repeat-containing protein [Acidobacteria bacterium]|nr:SBBP repeat-containing protein [Acidobacteriota bacterium]
MPVSFEANIGQADAAVKFIARAAGYDLLLTPSQASFQLYTLAREGSRQTQLPGSSDKPTPKKSTIKMKWLGANRRAKVSGVEPLPTKTNYFIGQDARKWRTEVNNFASVKYEQIYSGVDLLFYSTTGQLEYDFKLAPGADFRALRLRFEGAQKLLKDEQGDLLIKTADGEIRQHKPKLYQESAGHKTALTGDFRIINDSDVGFEVGAYDKSKPLMIDPVLSYSTYLGGSGYDAANDIAVDAVGNLYVIGTTQSINFPVINAPQSHSRNDNSADVFVAKLNPSGTAVFYATLIGGSFLDYGNSIAVDASGNVYVTGSTSSSDFPVSANAFQRQNQHGYGGDDAFVLKLNPNGDGLVYATFLGGSLSTRYPYPDSGQDIGYGIAVDALGNAYVTGETASLDFPIKKPLQTALNQGYNPDEIYHGGPIGSTRVIRSDAFVTKLNADGTGLVYSTFLGGRSDDYGRGIVVDQSGSACITGYTLGAGFPTAQALQSQASGRADAFLTKLNSSGEQLEFSTFIGGESNDFAYDLALDAAGNYYVVGETFSESFPTTPRSYQTALGDANVYKSMNSGETWGLTHRGLPNDPVSFLLVDPQTPTYVYAIVGDENPYLFNRLFRSDDGGHNWHELKNINSIDKVKIDPLNPSTLYANPRDYYQRVFYKSTDRGESWRSIRPSVITNQEICSLLAIDPNDSNIFYITVAPTPELPPVGKEAGPSQNEIRRYATAINSAQRLVPQPAKQFSEPLMVPSFHVKIFKTTDGGITWRETGWDRRGFSAIQIDPKRSTDIYIYSSEIFKSTDGGDTWNILGTADFRPQTFTFDPTNIAVLYAIRYAWPKSTVVKSTDNGLTWRDTGLTEDGIAILAIDPQHPATLYAGTRTYGYSAEKYFGRLFKSTDGGDNWKETGLSGAAIRAFAIDPLSPATVYTGTEPYSDGFVVKINANGSALLFSSYLGGQNIDSIHGVTVGAAGKVYVTGQTFSSTFPMKDAVQGKKASDYTNGSTFVAVLNSSGAVLNFSSYLSGSSHDTGSAIAVDQFGKIYITGKTTSADFPIATSLQRDYQGEADAFIAKISLPPRITSAVVQGKKLLVTGDNFDEGASILLNGSPYIAQHNSVSPTTLLVNKTAGKKIAPNQAVTLQVQNSDGALSNEFVFARPAN